MQMDGLSTLCKDKVSFFTSNVKAFKISVRNDLTAYQLLPPTTAKLIMREDCGEEKPHFDN